jgi:TldD protein
MSKLLREHDSVINAALKKAEELGVYLVLRINKNYNYSLHWKEAAIADAAVDSSEGIGIYTFTPSGHLAFGATNELTTDNIEKLVSDTSEVAKANQAMGADAAKEIYDLPFQENLGEDDLHYKAVSIESIPKDKMLDFAAEIESFLLKQEESIKPYIRFSIHQRQWRIVRSDGTDVDFVIPYSIAVVGFTMEKNGVQANGYTSAYTPTPAELLKQTSSIKEKLSEELSLAKDQLTAKPAVAGHYPIIITDKLAGLLVHEALGHPAESDHIAENGSVLGNERNLFRVGEQVAASGVTITDHEEGLSHGFNPYGAFGNKREAVTIIEDGLLKESISDVFTASKTGVLNKNAERSEHYGEVAIPRMSTTFLQLKKDMILEENLASASPRAVQKLLKSHGVFNKHKKVYYLIGSGGGQVSSKTGDFMFGSHYTYELTADGLTATKPVSFSGNVLEALKAIEFGVGKLSKEGWGICGKSGQSVYVNDGGHELVFFKETNHVSIA